MIRHTFNYSSGPTGPRLLWASHVGHVSNAHLRPVYLDLAGRLQPLLRRLCELHWTCARDRYFDVFSFCRLGGYALSDALLRNSPRLWAGRPRQSSMVPTQLHRGLSLSTRSCTPRGHSTATSHCPYQPHLQCYGVLGWYCAALAFSLLSLPRC